MFKDFETTPFRQLTFWFETLPDLMPLLLLSSARPAASVQQAGHLGLQAPVELQALPGFR